LVNVFHAKRTQPIVLLQPAVGYGQLVPQDHASSAMKTRRIVNPVEDSGIIRSVLCVINRKSSALLGMFKYMKNINGFGVKYIYGFVSLFLVVVYMTLQTPYASSQTTNTPARTHCKENILIVFVVIVLLTFLLFF